MNRLKKLLTLLAILAAAQAPAPNASAQAATCSPGAGENKCAQAGNPINVITGNKFQREVDLPALPGVMGLEIVRYYNSALSGIHSRTGILGRGWRLSYEVSLAPVGDTIQVLEADGTRLIFARDPLHPSLCASNDPANGNIEVHRTRDGDEYVWNKNDGRRLSFNRHGRLVQILAPTGEFVTMRHDARGWLVQVTDPQGRSLTLDYLDKQSLAAGRRFRGVQSIDTPVGRFDYGYGSALPQGGDPADRHELLANLVKVARPDGGTRQYHYEDAHFPTLLTGISVLGDDAQGKPALQRFATYGYDANGKAVMSTHAGGVGKITLDMSVGGRTVLTNSLGQQTVYRYSFIAGQQRLTEVRGAGCSQCGEMNVRYGYDALGRTTSVTRLDAAGVPSQGQLTRYDYYGRPVEMRRVAYRDGKPGSARLLERVEYAAQAADLPILVVRPSGVPGKEYVQSMRYNRAGQLLERTETGWVPDAAKGISPVAIARTSKYTYEVVNNRSVLTAIDGPLRNGLLGTPADSDITHFRYDASGSRIVKRIEPGNVVTEVTGVDTALRPTRIVRSDGARLWQANAMLAIDGQPVDVTESAWRLNGTRVLDKTYASRHFRYAYDGFGNLVFEKSPAGVVRRFLYDNGEYRTHAVASDNSQVVIGFDTEGRETEEAAYDAGGTAAVLSAYRAFTSDQHTRQGAVAARYRTGTAGTSADSVVDEVELAAGNGVRRWIDDFGRVTALRSADSGLRTARHDEADALIAVSDARGVETTVRRDAAGKVLEVVSKDASRKAETRIRYRYEGVTVVAATRFEQQRPDSKTVFYADAWGDNTGKEVQVFGTGPHAAPVALGVRNLNDPDGRVLQKTLPSGTTIDYRYDGDGRLTGIYLGRQALLQTGAYRGLDTSRPLELKYGNALASKTELGLDGRVRAHDTGLANIGLTLDDGGRVVEALRRPSEASSPASRAKTTSREADHEKASRPAASVPQRAGIIGHTIYAYDSDGRLASEQEDGVAVLDIAYTPAGDRTDAGQAAADPAGNVLVHGRQRLVYGPGNELVEVRDDSERMVAAYRYDADGVRVAKHLGHRTELFLYEDKRLTAVSDETGAVISEYLYIGDRPVVRLNHASSRDKRTLFGSGPAIEYIHVDQRGAVEAVTDDAGETIWTAHLGAFGEFRGGAQHRADMPLRLAGQYDDPETGLYYNVHRYYAPSTGRYLQPDPLGILGGLNVYAYVDSDPLVMSDPLGLAPEPDDTMGAGWKPWLFGTFVHSRFATQVRVLSLTAKGWGANDQRNGTWQSLRPDAYYLDNKNLANEAAGASFAGTLWELKPISWSSAQNSANYNKANNEVADYMKFATRGCWSAGSSSLLVRQLHVDQVIFGNRIYYIDYSADQLKDGSGLLFYTRREAPSKPAPSVVPAPSMSAKERAELDAQMQTVRNTIKTQTGWSDLAITGVMIVIGLAIALLAAVALVYAIPAIIATIAAAIELAGTGFSLLTAMAGIFGFSSTATAADMEKKGTEGKSGIIDSAIDWFKSWF